MFLLNPQVIFVALLATSLAELPAISHSYGVPEVSSGYSYQPQSVSTEYVEQHVGHQPSEGIHLDSHLLHKIEHILVEHENSRGNNRVISAPSHSYGVPQHSYGPPSHWSPSSRVVGINFGHLVQSVPVAQYLGTDRYASSYNTGYSSSSSTGWSAGNLGWSAPSKPVAAWIEPRAPAIISSSPGWSVASVKPASWTIARPSSKYGAPRW